MYITGITRSLSSLNYWDASVYILVIGCTSKRILVPEEIGADCLKVLFSCELPIWNTWNYVKIALSFGQVGVLHYAEILDVKEGNIKEHAKAQSLWGSAGGLSQEEGATLNRGSALVLSVYSRPWSKLSQRALVSSLPRGAWIWTAIKTVLVTRATGHWRWRVSQAGSMDLYTE